MTTSTRSRQSSRAEALGSRENWWGEPDVDELRETPIGELSTRDLRRYVRHETDHNVGVDRMDEKALRSYARKLRDGGHAEQPSVTAYEIARWKAHQVLRGVADKHSATAKHGSPDRGWPAAFGLVFAHLDGVSLVRDHDPLAIHTERCDVELTEPIVHVPKIGPKTHGDIEFGQYRHRRRVDPEHGYIGGVAFDDLPICEFLDVVEIVLETIQSRHGYAQRRIDAWLGLAKDLKQDPTMSDQDVLTAVLTEIYLDN